MVAKILIIDDDKEYVEVLKRGITREGFESVYAHTPTEALRLAKENQPDVITLDLKLGSSSGLEILTMLREQAPQSKIIVITGFASLGTAVKAIKQGADHYLPKPLKLSELLAVMGVDQSASKKLKSPSLNQPHLGLELKEWEHIQYNLEKNDFNISKTALQLGISRRTLQRKLKKKPNLD